MKRFTRFRCVTLPPTCLLSFPLVNNSPRDSTGHHSSCNFCDTAVKMDCPSKSEANRISKHRGPLQYVGTSLCKMNDIRHRASPLVFTSSPPVLSLPPFAKKPPKKYEDQLVEAKMRYILEIVFLLVTTTAALSDEKIDISVLKPCKKSEVSFQLARQLFFAIPQNPH